MLANDITHPICNIKPGKFLRKMRGGTQSSLVQADDGNFYIVKLQGNPQGTEVLFNEAFGAELMRFLGLPVPDWCALTISDEFIDKNPEMWFEAAGSGRHRPDAGLCFGSRLVSASQNETLYEVLPRQWFDLISNREDFVGILLFDMWAKQSDNRQVVFLQDIRTRSIRATFIDQGDLFARRKLPRRNARLAASFLDSLIYRNLDIIKIIPKWEARIRSITPSRLTSLGYVSTIPGEWYDPAKLKVLWTELLGRQRSISSYISEIKTFLEEVNNARGRLEGLRIQGIQVRAVAPQRSGCSVPCTRYGALP